MGEDGVHSSALHFYQSVCPHHSASSNSRAFPKTPWYHGKLLNALHLPFLSTLQQISKQTSVMLGSCLGLPRHCPARACEEDSPYKSVNGLGKWLLAPTLPCRSCKSNRGDGTFVPPSRFKGTNSVSPFCKICLSPKGLTEAS